MKNKNESKNENNIEIVIGDGTSLEISEVNDCMNPIRPNTLGKKKKNVIIPTEKKNLSQKQDNNSIDENSENKNENKK